jgi:hypothetical protein
VTRYWIAVASADHVRRGLVEGFMQVCHGNTAPLTRVRPGDRVVYYSPTVSFRGKERLQAFTAIGTVRHGDPYKVDMGEGFHPWRRDVDWEKAHDAPIKPLLDGLEFTAGKRNWGQPFRYGLVSVPAHDFGLIAEAMGAGVLV